MAKKKKRVRIDRVIILVLTALLFLSLVFFGVYSLINMLSSKTSNSSNNTAEIKDPEHVETSSNIKVEMLKDYMNYIDDTDKLGFNFIVAPFKFTSDSGVKFDLENLQTSQKIHLNNVSKYLTSLEDAGYKTSKLGITTVVVSDKNEYECKLFIPYTTEDSSLRINNAVDLNMFEFDLDSNIHYVSELKFDTSSNIDVNNTSVNVSSCSVSTMMLHNGQEYEVASTLKVFTFKININSIDGNVSITDAKFVKDGSDEEISCMSSEYSSVKVENVLGKKLVLGENGALFFETECYDDKPDYSGTLFLMFSNSNEWVKVNTTLE